MASTITKFTHKITRPVFKPGMWEKMLPDHYLKAQEELKTRQPIPVHWIPNPKKYILHPKTQRKTRVENIPIPAIYPKEADEGLWGGEGIVKGFQKRHHLQRRVPHFWIPRLIKHVLYSEILDRHMEIVVTPRTLNLIDEAFGFDNYILQTHAVDLKSKLGMTLKREMLLTLARKSMYPNDPVKREKVYKRYKKFEISEEEAEWVGLTMKEAVIKLRSQLEAETVVPLKETYKRQLTEELKNADTSLKQSDKDESKSWLSRLSPFKDDKEQNS